MKLREIILDFTSLLDVEDNIHGEEVHHAHNEIGAEAICKG